MAKLGLVYVALCEMVFALMAGALGVALIFANDTRSRIFGGEALVVASLCAIAAYGLFCARRWAWYGSWLVGLFVVAISIWTIRVAMQPDPYGDSGEAGAIGMAWLLFAAPAFVLMWLPSTRRYLGVGDMQIPTG